MVESPSGWFFNIYQSINDCMFDCCGLEFVVVWVMR